LATAATWAARSGLLCGRRSSRCRSCISESGGIALRRPLGIAFCLGQVVVQSRSSDAHQPADFLDGVATLVIELQGELLALRVEALLASALVTSRVSRRQAGAGALANQVALELGQRTEQMKHEAATDDTVIVAICAAVLLRRRVSLPARKLTYHPLISV
jgi:hypothetical protein